MTKILKLNPVNPEMDKIIEAAAVIKSGGLVAFPTETVYGVGADLFNADACANIFKVKNRPVDNPMIVHVSSIGQLQSIAIDIPKKVEDALKVLWPGPVTFILKRNPTVPPTERRSMVHLISVRMPAHPIALRLIEESGVPIAAPSANLSTKPSGTKAEHVGKDLYGKIDMILDGGDTAFGLESTIIDATVEPYVLRRPGAFTVIELQKFLGGITVPDSINRQLKDDEIPIAPGMKYRHYSPEKRLVAVNGTGLLADCVAKALEGSKVAVLCSNEAAVKMPKKATVIRLGSELSLYEVAKNLFDSFRKLDETDVDVAFIQTFPEKGIGLALMNRIVKAAGSEVIASQDELSRLMI